MVLLTRLSWLLERHPSRAQGPIASSLVGSHVDRGAVRVQLCVMHRVPLLLSWSGDGCLGRHSADTYYSYPGTLAGPCHPQLPCTARFVAQTTKCRGDSPRTSGGRVCLAAVSFLSPFGWPRGACGGEAPGSRPVHGSWTAPARIRGGTQGIANLKGCSCKLQFLGGFGAGPRQVSFSCNGSTV